MADKMADKIKEVMSGSNRKEVRSLNPTPKKDNDRSMVEIQE